MKKIKFSISELLISIFIPEPFKPYSTIIYTHMADDNTEAVAKLQGNAAYILVNIDGVDWNKDLSPWPAPKVFRNGDTFTGGADGYLEKLTKDIVPTVEKKIGVIANSRAIAGYSLSGLFAIYALYRTDIFNCAASISGSLWYDGFLDFMVKNRPVRTLQKVYFSLGDRESKAKNQRFARVGKCTAEAEVLLRSCGAATKFELNKGNHFVDIPERIAKGLNWISI